MTSAREVRVKLRRGNVAALPVEEGGGQPEYVPLLILEEEEWTTTHRPLFETEVKCAVVRPRGLIGLLLGALGGAWVNR